MPKSVFCLMGPTASYKTKFACELSDQFPFEIVSVDSAMIYRGMDIGTAKPSLVEQKRYPHHLVDILDPVETYSASVFCNQANQLIEEIFSRGKLPLLVGGTMMYFKVLQQGLSILPDANPEIRARLLQEAESVGWEQLHNRLKGIDSCSASRIHPHDTQRIQRALEVYYLTGRPFSEFFILKKDKKDYHFINLILFPETRENIHDRIAQRFQNMLEQGLVEEVVSVKKKWHVESHFTAMRSVGYRQVFDYLEGKYDLETLKEKGIAATRQLAKRQMTWLRKWENPLFFDPEKSEEILEELATSISIILDRSK